MKRKVTLSVVSILIMIILMTISAKVYASTNLNPNLYFGIQEFRDDGMGYAIKNPYDNGSSGNIVGAKIWQIVKYHDNSGTGSYDTGDFYCVRAGLGFNDTTKSATYNISYDFNLEKNSLTSINPCLSTYHSNILALVDLFYLHGVSTETERKDLLENAGIYEEDYSAHITDNEIEAVQQAALWYYTNHDDSAFDKVYNNYGETKSSWLFYNTSQNSQSDKNYKSLSDYDMDFNDYGAQVGDGKQRQEQAEYLYDYLIKTAEKNAEAYKNGTVTSNRKITLYTNATGNNTQPIIEIEKVQEILGEYKLVLEKQDSKGNQLSNSDVTFTVSKKGDNQSNISKTFKGKIELETQEINAQNYNIVDEYEIKEAVAPNGYIGFDGTITVKVTKKKDNNIYKVEKIDYTVKDANGTDITNNNGDVNVELKDGKIYVRVKNHQTDGAYNVVLVKEDENGVQLDSKATFEVNNVKKEVVGILQVASNVKITEENVSKEDTYIIKELEPPDEYCKLDGIITVTVTKKDDNGTYKVDNVEYTVKDSQGNDITDATKDDVDVYLNSNGNIYVKVKNYQNDGDYDIVLVKQDENGEQLDSKATFEVDGETKEVVGRLQIASDVKINSDNVSQKDTYVIKELVPPDEYCKFDGIITVTVTKKNENGTYKVDNVTYKVEDSEGKDITDSTKNDAKVYLNNEGNIYVEVKNYQFDLKLIKRIVEVNGVQVPERIEDVDITELANGSKTTATYKLNKNPVPVKKGDIVKYTLRVYNEGGIDGYASEITEDVPDGLEFIWSEKTDADLDADTTLSKEEKDAIKYNQSIWDFGNINSQTNRVETITTNYLAKGQGEEKVNEGANLIKAFDPSKEYKNTINDKNPDYKEVSVYMRVISEGSVGTIIRNEAAVTEDTDSKGNPVDDRDSNPDNWVKYEDDEDYDNVILESFDLVLRKFIIAVSSDTTIEDAEYLKEEDGKYTREPSVDTSKLNTTDENGKLITTATYNHTKEPVEVSKNDIVVYMLRVYNEGSIDGYASEIKDHLPPYLEYVDSDFNKQYGWKVSEDGRTVTTTYLDSHLISKATENEEGKIVLSYKEVPIMCKVTDKAQGKITNIADITVSKDADKNDMLDRDSEPGNVVLPGDSDLPQYKDDEKGTYIPGQQDDDDFEKVVVRTFDLALRKFITAVDNNEVTTRIPQVKYDKDNNKLTYQHTKDPVDVVTNDIVTYTIRVYNEGQIDGYASEITDDIPDGLQYIPNNDLNKEYRWVMYDSEGKETQDISKATKIKTDYLSKEQGEARMEDDEEMEENPALLKAFDNTKEISETNPDYADVKVSFKVTEPNGSSRILVNSAQISEDTDKDGNPVDDEDSIPDKWNEGEDDQDKEYVKLNYFDLALRKWVTQAIVIEDGKETVTQTGHKPEDDPEQVVKVELNRKKLNSIQVKFKYSIRITNEGDIAGYAKEITDYIPQGLQFVAADNPDWKDEGNNIISTRKLENTLLQPGQSADVEVTLTWIKGTSNLGLKTNIAEISEDYNDKNVPDRDSTPDNKIEGEDDIDDAPVLLSISTGKAKMYFVLTLTILTTIAGGLILIRRFVL